METDRHVLIDTCVWIDSLRYDKCNTLVKSVLGDSTICINDLIKFELEIGLSNNSHQEKWEDIKNKLFNLPISSDIVKILESYKNDLAKIRKKGKVVTPSGVDAVIAAQAIKYKKSNFYVLTSNHKDFPTELFERFETFWIDIDKPFTLCLYKAK